MNNYISIKGYCLLIALSVLTACTTVYHKAHSPDFEALYGASAPIPRFLAESDELGDTVSYHKDIKPILDARCVACHACYDAPCQLKLGSTAGIDRGATKQRVYDGTRLKPAEPTRLFIDAVNTEGWRSKAFYPVLNERKQAPQAALNNSLLAKLLQLKRSHPLPESGKLAESFALDIERTLECPRVDEFAQYQQDHPDWGMPYAMPGLSLKQEYTLMKWLQEGAKFDSQPVLSAEGVTATQQWEGFFNGQSLKQQLVARYIYEHLFIGHLHFQGHSANEFYRLIRSTTPPGEPVNEIATRHPYDDPGVSRFYYRLRPVENSLVEKTHFVYELSADKMQRYHELFFQPDYRVKQLPSYQPEVAANPFVAFVDMPPGSRYQFMLDDAQFFVSGFIKGPVCRGQLALNVIRDRFWVVFFHPSAEKVQSDMLKEMGRFLAEQLPTLSLPGTAGDELGLFGYKEYDELANQYLQNKEVFVDQLIDKYGAFHLDDIWDGGGVNRNAALTVFRHSESATVVQGLIGETPLTAWIIDYPLFERIHYLLVAGFDVYSSLNHQLASRSYMDFLRVDGENNFLRFMPAEQRNKIHDSWYKGTVGSIVKYLYTPYYSANHETGVNYLTADYKKEFFEQVRQRLGKAVGVSDSLNQCVQEACISKGTEVFSQDVEQQMRILAQLKGRELDVLPDMSLVRVRHPQKPSADLVYTLVLNKALKNVAIMIAENDRREPELDTLTVLPGFLGSYPNFFFNVQQQQLPAFIAAIKNARSAEDKEAFYSSYGIRRTNPEIWAYVDWFNAQHKQYRGLQAGLFDLNRYNNL